MENAEIYWSVVSHTVRIISLVVEGWFFYYFTKPFLHKSKYDKWIGISYSAAMLVLYLIPYLFLYPKVWGVLVTFIVMCLIGRRNISQKLFLVITMYLLQGIAQSVSLVPRTLLFTFVINTQYMTERALLQFILYIFVELITCVLKGLFLYWLVFGIHKVYVNKRENVSRKELLLLLSILFTVLIGYFAFAFFSDIYVMDTGQYIWNVHEGYNLLEIIY
ncbi:MAG: hypothetical protein PHY47_27925 [Lachnospiraceae bacterium]|nr:hypothetical protein [Lachnospiraceae bacterium]